MVGDARQRVVELILPETGDRLKIEIAADQWPDEYGRPEEFEGFPVEYDRFRPIEAGHCRTPDGTGSTVPAYLLTSLNSESSPSHFPVYLAYIGRLTEKRVRDRADRRSGIAGRSDMGDLLGRALQTGTHLAAKRDAVRLLLLMQKAGTKPGVDVPDGVVREVRAEKRLQALDFWLRNPDYLAHEYLDRYDETHEDANLEMAWSLMNGDEPELHRLSMLRFHFGAWEAVDDAVATLNALDLARVIVRMTPDQSKIKERRYYLTALGDEKATELAYLSPLDWYAERAVLVAEIAGKRTGNQLKQKQYSVAAYHDARHGAFIDSIAPSVRARLAEHGRIT